METKNKKDPCFAQARYLWAKLCNIFDEAFLFDVSILVLALYTGYPDGFVTQWLIFANRHVSAEVTGKHHRLNKPTLLRMYITA